uniref:SRR1-like protein n=1 Tax=Cacopsylla melanoneura TaxID=428564 RepID=A0A8D8PUL0_9HEMI
MKEELESSTYYLELLNSISKSLATSSASTTQGIDEIICYGIGNFTDSIAAKYQLVLLLLLKQEYKCPVWIYDPIFNELEIELIKTFNLKLITVNEECKHKIESKTLVYMPRCPIQLINNLLYSNWYRENLKNTILLSNSITTIIDSNTDNFLKSNLTFIFHIKTILEEIPVENNFKFKDIFNDTSLHYFPSSNLNSVEEDIWDLRSLEPSYTECNFEKTK